MICSTAHENPVIDADTADRQDETLHAEEKHEQAFVWGVRVARVGLIDRL